jgi:signal transduction histidine kinase/ActR/RegA family two-component response regulator
MAEQVSRVDQDNLQQVKTAYEQMKIYAQELNTEILERRRAQKASEQRAAQMTLINDIGGQVAAVLELDQVLSRAAQLVREMFDYHRVALYLLDGAAPALKAIAGQDPSESDVDQDNCLNEGLITWVAQHGEQIVANDIREEPRFTLTLEQPLIQAELCLPMKMGGRTVGVLDIQSKHLNAFSENDVFAMETLSTQIAIAIENARLHEAVRQELTERKRAEAALAEERALLAERISERTAELSAANVELARAARLKDEFLASMSHELRTPLNGILGMTETLQEKIYGPLNERQLKALQRVEESGRHLLALINDILDLSKIEAGKFDLQIGPIPLEAVCEASLRLIKQEAHKKRLKITASIDAAVTTLQADKRRLKQILVNLLSNAIKFTPAGGAIGLEVVGWPELQAVNLTVWDQGIGIAPEGMDRLFKPFVQLDSALARQYEGSGLGLALVYRMVEMHGGCVTVESEIGQGSRFTVSLPWQETDVPDTLDETPDQPSLLPLERRTSSSNSQGPVVLLVEDNETLIETVMDYLQDKGYRLIVARDGENAVEQATLKQPDLILMDIQMPGIDGLEATRRLRADTTLALIPIIALTALAMPGDRERCLEAGANEYLSKPVSLKRLVSVIEAQLQQRA